MAKYRNVSVKFWSDDFVAEELTPEKRYFFLYLLTNEHTAQCGIYEITKRQMAFETGYNAETVEKLLQYFETHGKIRWSRETNEIAIKNFIRYNPQGSPKVKSYVTKELTAIKNQTLVEFIYGTENPKTSKSGELYPIDPLSQEEREEELEREEEKEQSKKVVLNTYPFEDFWTRYDKKADRPKCEKKWESLTQVAREKIMEHLKAYVPSTPDKKYRKNPLTYLNSGSWENEIITSDGNSKDKFNTGAALSHIYASRE